VVAASRPPGPGPVPLSLERAFGGRPLRTVAVGPMSVGELHRLVHIRLGAWLPRPVLRRVHAASGGNPFFALEIARSLIRRGRPASTDALPVPPTIGELVRDRLEPLSPGAREALLVVSAVPRAPVALVTAAAGEDGQIVAGLAEAEDAGILTRDDGGLEFTHPLLASVVYSQVPPARRRRLHRAIAAAMAGSGADARTRAWHLGLGAEGPDAGIAEALDAAAASARSAAAPEGAAGLSELARRLTPVGRDRDRVRRTLDLARYLFEAGDTTGARSELEALVAEMVPGPDRAQVLLSLAVVRYWAESHRAIELEEGSAERPTVTWRAKSNLGVFLMWAYDFDEARAILEADRQDAADEGDWSSLPDILWQLAELELCAGDWSGPPTMRTRASRRPSGQNKRS
jgi:hypothetical protein